MNRKFKLKQWWSTIPPISTNEQVTEHTHTYTLEPHMALELHPLAWNWWNPCVMELTKTLVINVVPTSYNSKCRERKNICLPLVCFPNMKFYIWITDILFVDLYTSYSKHITVGIVVVAVLIMCTSVTAAICQKCK